MAKYGKNDHKIWGKKSDHVHGTRSATATLCHQEDPN